jgi:hypothetical protein
LCCCLCSVSSVDYLGCPCCEFVSIAVFVACVGVRLRVPCCRSLQYRTVLSLLLFRVVLLLCQWWRMRLKDQIRMRCEACASTSNRPLDEQTRNGSCLGKDSAPPCQRRKSGIGHAGDEAASCELERACLDDRVRGLSGQAALVLVAVMQKNERKERSAICCQQHKRSKRLFSPNHADVSVLCEPDNTMR